MKRLKRLKRRSILAGLIAAAWLFTAGGEASAQVFTITTTVDENGHGTLTNSTGFTAPLPFAMAADPGPGGLASAATYDLQIIPSPPLSIVAGDVILLEPGAPGVTSDVIRFNASSFVTGSKGSLVFYSDRSDGADSLADTGFPSALYTNLLTLTEVGPEIGPNGISYTPLAGQPGFVNGAAGPVTYVIQSDLAVPEPSSFALGGVGALALLAVKAIRRRRRAA